MDDARKVAREKRLAIALAGLFAAAFILGSVKGWGLFQRPRVSPGRSEAVDLSKPVGELLKDHWTQMEPALPQAGGLPTASRPPAVYTAHGLRDPFEALLPAAPEAVPQGSAPATVAAKPELAPPPAPPPILHVQGLLWGGRTPQAIIGHDVYAVGDVVAGATIVAIDHRGVGVNHQGALVFYPPEAIDRQRTRRPSPQHGAASSARPQQWR